MDDLDIVAQLRLGNKKVFQILVDRYQSKLRGFCYNMLSSSELAEEVAQEVFITAYQNIKKFRADSSFATWLFKITRNKCIDLLRKKQRNSSVSWDQIAEKHGDLIHRLDSDSINLEEQLQSRELISLILAQLDDKSREVLILRELHQFSYQEIAEILDLSVDSIKGKLKRVRKEITEKFRHFLDPDTSMLIED